MTDAVVTNVTQLLRRVDQGDVHAAEGLLPLVYDELRRLAQHLLAGEPAGHQLQATALVHEAYLRLVEQQRVEWRGRAHFFAVAATVIRRVLVDEARVRQAVKRGGQAQRVTLHDSVALVDHGQPNLDLLALHEALEQLERLDARQARVVELRFFTGMSVDETAEVLGVSSRTIVDDWRFARAWLKSRLSDGDTAHGA